MTQRIAELANGIRFFQENAGHFSPPGRPGRMACALRLAEAERDAQLMGWNIEWEWDEAGCLGCECGSNACNCFTRKPHETWYATLKDGAGRILTSFGGICEPWPDYRRVVAAELALEAFEELKGVAA
jgi:hypothetical protein